MVDSPDALQGDAVPADEADDPPAHRVRLWREQTRAPPYTSRPLLGGKAVGRDSRAGDELFRPIVALAAQRVAPAPRGRVARRECTGMAQPASSGRSGNRASCGATHQAGSMPLAGYDEAVGIW